MFNDSDRDFISNDMKIVVESIESKLNEPFFSEFKVIAVDAISQYIREIKKFEASGVKRGIYSSLDNEAENLICEHFRKITDGMEHNEVYQVLDALRHSFSCYAYNGLHQLYTRQENECWHPKIWLTEVIDPNDIDSLPDMVTIYRGCDINELSSQDFGQAWSTSLEVAKEFAYKHYANQDWFDENRRVVLETICAKKYLLYSNQSMEFEVVVSVENLSSVHQHT